ncbi:DinB family protein [Flexivirga sp. B27]
MSAATDTTPEFDPAARTDPPGRGTEAETLLAYLRYHRDTFRWKTGGLTGEQLAHAVPPSDMTLGGMIKHLALVEVSWFDEFFAGADASAPWASVDWENDPDWEWRTALDDSPVQLAELYEHCVQVADGVIANAIVGDGLDALSVRAAGEPEEPFTLRWIMIHMIEEYARHNGHADFIRQSIDGATGE